MTAHTDFASTATAPVYDPWVGSMARNAGFPVPAAPAVDSSIVPPSLALHTRQTVSHPADVPPPSRAADEINRTFHPPVPFGLATISPAPARPRIASVSGDAFDADLTAAQIAIVASSQAKVDRSRTYAARLEAHAAEIRARLAAASDHTIAAAIGTAESDPADVGPLRGELLTVERQHGQALAILAEVEAEHARHEADLATLTGSGGAARAKLAEAHAARDAAQTAADKAKAIRDRAQAHAEAVRAKLDAARADEARHDAEATARLRAALAEGDALPVAAEPLARTSGALEDDLRAATAAVNAITADHAAKASALDAARRAVLIAADDILVVEAEAVARELLAADALTLALRVRLYSFTARRAADWIPPALRPRKLMPGGWYEPDPASLATPPAIRTTPIIGEAIASAPAPQSGGLVSPRWANEDRAWSDYAAALAADPQAVPDFSDGASEPAWPSLSNRAA